MGLVPMELDREIQEVIIGDALRGSFEELQHNVFFLYFLLLCAITFKNMVVFHISEICGT